jgi:hypothetical protein
MLRFGNQSAGSNVASIGANKVAKQRSEGSNGATPGQIKAAFDDVLRCHAELATERGSYMQRCQHIRKEIADIYESAEDYGINRRALKAKVKEHQLQEKLLAIREALEEDDRSEFDQCTEALGDFGGTPLGAAALDGARHRDALDELAP